MVKVSKRVTLDLGLINTRKQARELRDKCPVLAVHFNSTSGLDVMASRSKKTYSFSRRHCMELDHDPDNCPLKQPSKNGNSKTKRQQRRRGRSTGVQASPR